MNTLLSTLDTTTGLGLNFQAWVPVLCLCLFAVLGLYAMLLMFGGQYFSKWRRFLLPSTLAARIALGISIAASLPIISLILIGAYGAAGAWLIGAVIIAAWLAIAFSRGIIIPLRALDQSVRDFDLNAIQESVAPPIDAHTK